MIYLICSSHTEESYKGYHEDLLVSLRFATWRRGKRLVLVVWRLCVVGVGDAWRLGRLLREPPREVLERLRSVCRDVPVH